MALKAVSKLVPENLTKNDNYFPTCHGLPKYTIFGCCGSSFVLMIAYMLELVSGPIYGNLF